MRYLLFFTAFAFMMQHELTILILLVFIHNGHLSISRFVLPFRISHETFSSARTPVEQPTSRSIAVLLRLYAMTMTYLTHPTHRAKDAVVRAFSNLLTRRTKPRLHIPDHFLSPRSHQDG